MKCRLGMALLVLLTGVLLWRLTARRPEVAANAVPNTPAVAVADEVPQTSTTSLRDAEPAATPESTALAAPAEIVPGADLQHRTQVALRDASSGPEVAPGLEPAIVLENMRRTFRQYSSRFGGNPVGTNAEITRSLNGNNPKHVVFLNPQDGLRINDRGELVDNWGTPFFFHQLSATEMEIHSAGPDRVMWTGDDLVTK